MPQRVLTGEDAERLDKLQAEVCFEHYGQGDGTTKVAARLRDRATGTIFHSGTGGTKAQALADALATAPAVASVPKPAQDLAAELDAAKQREAELQAELERLRAGTKRSKR